jgi:uncharacterized membrane protein
MTTAFTLIVRIPIAPTRGYITLADVGVYFAAFALGPVVGAIAGGVGTALADAIGGYPHWIVFSLIIHGAQGLAAGLLGYKTGLFRMTLGFLIGAVIMIGGYFGVSILLYGLAPALSSVPGNIFQAAAGGIVGIPLVYAVRKAYPPIDGIGQARTWTELGPAETPETRRR